MTVIGYTHRSGSFNGHDYSFYIVYLIYPCLSGEGQACTSVKYKGDNLPALGDVVTPYYDRFGNCIGFDSEG